MNRTHRRPVESFKRRNSKNNIKFSSTEKIPLNHFVQNLVHNESLKEVDEALLELMDKSYEWKIKNPTSKQIISAGLSYLDSLCSLRFDITPEDDRERVRTAMRWISDIIVIFISLYKKQVEKTLNEICIEAMDSGEETIHLEIARCEDYLPYYGDVADVPSSDDVDDMYANFVVLHANRLAQVLGNVKCSDISDDETAVLEVLLFIIDKTKQLLPECDAA